MLSFTAGMRIFVGIEPVDMRGSFNALAGAVRGLGLAGEAPLSVLQSPSEALQDDLL